MVSRTILAAAILGAGLMAGSAHAQFDGIYVGGGLSLLKGAAEVDSSGIFGSKGTRSDDSYRAGVNLNAGYGHSWGNFNLAGEFNYLSAPGKFSYTFLGTPINVKHKGHWALSLLPAYKLNNTTMVFGRLGFVEGKSSFSIPGTSDEQKYKGTIYGIGVKHAFNRNWSGVLEYQNVSERSKPMGAFGGAISLKPNPAGLVLGAQYAF